MQLFDLASGQTDIDPQWPFALWVSVRRALPEAVRISEVRQLDLAEVTGDGVRRNDVVAGRGVEGV